MTIRRACVLRRHVAALAAASIAALVSHAAQAQSTVPSSAPTDGREIDDIVVTATKMGAESLQRVPLAITAFSSDQLQERGIKSLADIQAAAPNVVMGRATDSAILTIRGIGSSNVFIGSDPSSTVHIDGVYIARPNMVLGDFVDLERIEVLRGPQGTLYGRNAVGGTINIITRKPDDQLRIAASGEYGSYDLRRATASISGPLVGDTVTASIAGLVSDRDGYVRNLDRTIGDLDGERIRAVRGALRLRPADTLTIDLSGDYFQTRGSGPMYKPTYHNVDGSAPAVMPLFISDFHTVNIDNKQFNNINTWGFAGTAVWDLSPNVKLTSITGYRGLKQNWLIDVDFSEVNEWLQQFKDRQQQFSQEFQITGKTGPVKWVAGLYYLRESIDFDLDFQPQFIWGIIPNLHVYVDSHLKANAYAAFTQSEISLNDRLKLIVGGRYSYEEKRFSSFGRALVPPDGAIIPIPGYPFVRDRDKTSSGAFTPRFGVDYQVNNGLLVYGSATRGFKSGGFNVTGTEPAYRPETIWAYEAGLKTTLLDRRLQLNASAFYYDYKNLQVQAFTPQGTLDITNAASSTIKGVELEITAKPASGLQLSLSGAYLDATYDRYVTARSTAPNLPLDLSGNTLNFAPKWMFTPALSYNTELSNGWHARFNIDYRWQSRIYFSAFNDQPYSQSSYGLLGGEVAIATPGKNWELALYGRNLTNKDYTVGAYDFSETGTSKFITEPRVIGLRLRYRH